MRSTSPSAESRQTSVRLIVEPSSHRRPLSPAQRTSSHDGPPSHRLATHRRSMLGLGLGFGTLITLSACTPRDTGSLESGEPVRGGVLTYFEPQTWTLLYPPSVGFYPNGGIMNNISARLLWQDPETLELH